MRKLINAYFSRLDSKLFSEEPFDALVAWLEIFAWVLVGVAVTAAFIILAVSSIAGPQSQHGSCKSEHWAGKVYVCDEYYPLPEHSETR